MWTISIVDLETYTVGLRIIFIVGSVETPASYDGLYMGRIAAIILQIQAFLLNVFVEFGTIV
jgi:hypothetical protein